MPVPYPRPTTAQGWADLWVAQEFAVLPIAGKNANINGKGWQTRAYLSPADVSGQFPPDRNVGVMLGPDYPSLLVDADPDDPWTRRLGELWPHTNLTFWRASLPEGERITHRFWRLASAEAFAGLRNWTGYSWAKNKGDREKIFELRVHGQTMAPGSVHPDTHEPVLLGGDGPPELPPVAEYGALLRAARLSAAISNVCRQWPGPGIGRGHDWSMHLQGGLAYHGADDATIETVVGRAAQLVGDPHWRERVAGVRETRARIARGDPTTGFHRLEEDFELPGFGKHLIETLGLKWRGSPASGHPVGVNARSRPQPEPEPEDAGANPATAPTPRRHHARDGGLPGVFTGQQLDLAQIPVPVWLVEGLIQLGSFVSLQGRPKGGKSFLAFQLALCFAAGIPFLGMRTSAVEGTGGKVLLLVLEDRPHRLQHRLRRMASGLGLDRARPWLGNLTLTTFRDNDLEGDAYRAGLSYLDALIEEHRPSLVVVDTLPRLVGDRGRHGGYDADYLLGAAFQTLAQERDVGLLGLMHTKKRQDAEEDHLDASQGTSGMTAAQDCVCTLSHPRGTRQGRLRATGRDLDDDLDVGLEYDPAVGPWTCTGPTPRKLTEKERGMRFLADFLAARPRLATDCVTLGNAFLGARHQGRWWRDALDELGGTAYQVDGGHGNVWMWSYSEDGVGTETGQEGDSFGKYE